MIRKFIKYSSNIHIHQGYKGDLEGSITVEASFIIPIVIFLIFALMYLSFYLHDLCKIQGTVDYITHKAGLLIKHDTEISTGEILYEDTNNRGVFYLFSGSTDKEKEQITEYVSEMLSHYLFLLKIKEIKVEVTKFKLTINVKAGAHITMKGFPYFFDGRNDKNIIGEYTIHNPAESIRRSEVILETGSNIKGIDELKEKLEKFLFIK